MASQEADKPESDDRTWMEYASGIIEYIWGEGASGASSDIAAPPEEPTLVHLIGELDSVPEDSIERRGVLSLLGLCLGDVVGVPFEFSKASLRRADEAAAVSREELEHLVLQSILLRIGAKGLAQPYARSFSDDTVCADLKMQAVALCTELRKDPARETHSDLQLLWSCYLSQLLAWSGGKARGSLFQGYGAFTRALLRPPGAKSHQLVRPDPFGGSCHTWPTPKYLQYATDYCAGKLDGTPASYGNGVVMSFVPQALTEVVAPQSLQTRPHLGLAALANTHQHATAVLAADLLRDILLSIFNGKVKSPRGLRDAVRKSETWMRMMSMDELLGSHLHPVRQFDSFLSEAGDCSDDDTLAFMMQLVGSLEEAQASMAPAPYGAYLSASDLPQGCNLGRLLRSASNLWEEKDKNASEKIRFSQRGLNTVLIAIWCCAGASNVGDWIARLLYVGGDADTIGAASGQIAGPLFGAVEVYQAFAKYVSLADCVDKRPSALVAEKASRRFWYRAMLFCKGEWDKLLQHPRLVDPAYLDVTNERGSRTLPKLPLAAVRVLWVDYNGLWKRRHWSVNKQIRSMGEAEAEGLLTQTVVYDFQEAKAKLESRENAVGASRIDAVVVELGPKGGPYLGLQALEVVNDSFGNRYAERPLVVLLTSCYDRTVFAEVKKSPRVILVRRDRPEEIVAKIVEGHYEAASIPSRPRRGTNGTLAEATVQPAPHQEPSNASPHEAGEGGHGAIEQDPEQEEDWEVVPMEGVEVTG